MKSSLIQRYMAGAIVAVLIVGIDPGLFSSSARASEDEQAASAARPGPGGLRVRQERLGQAMSELEAKIMALADALEADEPEQARRLREARARSQEEGITATMGRIAALIESGDLRGAERLQAEVINKLHEIIMLLEEDDALDRYLDEAEMLEQFRRDLDELIRRATDTALDTERLMRKDEILEDLERRIRELEELEQAQRQVNEQFAENQGRGLRALGRVADEQHTVRRDTERLMEAIRREMAETGLHRPEADAEGEPIDGAAPGEAVPGEGEPGQAAAPGEGEPGEAGAPGEGEPGEAGVPGEGEPGQAAAPGEGEPGEAGVPGEGAPGEGAPGEGARAESEASPMPGQQAMGRAVEHQQQAEQQAGQGRGRNAQAEGEAAADELRRAIAELRDEMDRIAQLPEEEVAAAQQDVADATGDLAERMAQAQADGMSPWGEPGAGEPGDGEPGDGEPGAGEPGAGEPGAGEPGAGEPSAGEPGAGEPGAGEPGAGEPGAGEPGAGEPGAGEPGAGEPGAGEPGAGEPQTPQQQVERAREQMEGAAERIREAQPEQARPDQDDAIRRLQEAREEIERRLAQIREEMQHDLLAALEARFRAMLGRQLNINSGTERLAAVDRDQWQRPEQLLRSELVNEERAVGQMGRRALEIILEDGTTVIFPAIVAGLIEDIDMVADRLDEGLVDELTQAGQEDIVATLRELIEALERAQELADADNGEGEGDEGGEPQAQPLVPDSAELKLLRAAQLRVNNRTVMFDRHRAEAGDAEPGQAAYSRNLSRMQQKVADMTYDLIYRR